MRSYKHHNSDEYDNEIKKADAGAKIRFMRQPNSIFGFGKT